MVERDASTAVEGLSQNQRDQAVQLRERAEVQLLTVAHNAKHPFSPEGRLRELLQQTGWHVFWDDEGQNVFIPHCKRSTVNKSNLAEHKRGRDYFVGEDSELIDLLVVSASVRYMCDCGALLALLLCRCTRTGNLTPKHRLCK